MYQLLMEDTPRSTEAAFKKCLGPQLKKGAGKAWQRNTASARISEIILFPKNKIHGKFCHYCVLILIIFGFLCFS